MKVEINNIKFPRFISNKPCGIDKFEGKSQERLTDAIANHIISTDINTNIKCFSRIIGLEGGWGVGKTNVIKQLKEHSKIKDNYYIFEYDAWGHQEDLQRRSFLEKLTSEMIEKELLLGSTEITIKGGEVEKVTWQEKLKYLLARKTEKISQKYPRIGNSIIISFFIIVLSPYLVSISSTILPLINIKWLSLFLQIILPLLPIMIFAAWIIKKKKTGNISSILSIYTDKVENDICYETISEEEPTVKEFKSWMSSISEHIEKNNQKLIIVYDNMDRLPAEKVKELWSSIHTFFSEGDFNNIWAIIPFDEKHLSCAFGESTDKELLTKYFISKTFPVVYRVTPPVITDFKKILNTLFEEAFGKEIDKQEEINRIFRLEKPNATVREMIDSINQIVALNNIWKDTISLFSISLFVLYKDEILRNDEQIINGEYLSKINHLIENSLELQKDIAALVYGVLPNDALQIHISNYIKKCLQNSKDEQLKINYKITQFKDHQYFLDILDKEITESEISTESLILVLSELPDDFEQENKKKIQRLWNYIAKRQIKENNIGVDYKIIKSYFEKSIMHVDNVHQSKLIQYLCEKVQSKFDSKNYYITFKKLDDFITSNKLNINIIDYLKETTKEPEFFIEYVLQAKENYLRYKLKVNHDELVDYLSDRVIDKYSDLEVLKYLIKDENFQFNPLKENIEEIINDQNLVEDNNFKPILDAYKILSTDKPLKVQLNSMQRQRIWNMFSSKSNVPGFIEIVTIQIVNGGNIPNNIDEEKIRDIAENIDYYSNYGELLINNLSFNIPILNQVLKYMTERKLGIKLSLEKVLSKFFEITMKIGVEESILLEQLNGWERYKNNISKDNIQSIFEGKPQFFECSVATKNNLTDYLNKTIVEKLSEVSFEDLNHQKKNLDSYWYIVIKNLIDTTFLSPLPDNLTELGKRLLDDIAKSVPNSNKELFLKIIEKLDRRKTKETITNIKNSICNNQNEYKIDKNKFLFLHEWLEKQGDLSEHRPGDVCQYILTPIIDDEDCLNIILGNDNLYVSIIKKADTQAETLKNKIKEKLNNKSDENLTSFAKAIGVELSTELKDDEKK